MERDLGQGACGQTEEKTPLNSMKREHPRERYLHSLEPGKTLFASGDHLVVLGQKGRCQKLAPSLQTQARKRHVKFEHINFSKRQLTLGQPELINILSCQLIGHPKGQPDPHQLMCIYLCLSLRTLPWEKTGCDRAMAETRWMHRTLEGAE